MFLQCGSPQEPPSCIPALPRPFNAVFGWHSRLLCASRAAQSDTCFPLLPTDPAGHGGALLHLTGVPARCQPRHGAGRRAGPPVRHQVRAGGAQLAPGKEGCWVARLHSAAMCTPGHGCNVRHMPAGRQQCAVSGPAQQPAVCGRCRPQHCSAFQPPRTSAARLTATCAHLPTLPPSLPPLAGV